MLFHTNKHTLVVKACYHWFKILELSLTRTLLNYQILHESSISAEKSSITIIQQTSEAWEAAQMCSVQCIYVPFFQSTTWAAPLVLNIYIYI